MSNTCKKAEAESEEKLTKGRKVYRGTGRYKTGWNQEDLWKIVKAICKKCPGITRINIERNEIIWHYEVSFDDLLGKNKRKINPSKRGNNNGE